MFDLIAWTPHQRVRWIYALLLLTALVALPAIVHAGNPGEATTTTGQTLRIEIETSARSIAADPVAPLPISGQAIIGELPTSTSVLYVVDVSGSTTTAEDAPQDQDCNGDGERNEQDDVNGDDIVGSTLDCEVSGVLALNNSLLASGVSAGLALFADTGQIADVSSEDGDQTFANPLDADNDDNDVADLEEAILSLREEGIDLHRDKMVRPGTSFEAALEQINSAFDGRNGTKIAFFLSDGDDQTDFDSDESNSLAEVVTAGITVNTYSIGEAGTGCGEDADLFKIADATGGDCFPVNDPTRLPEMITDIGEATDIERVEVRLNDGTPTEASLTVLGDWNVEFPANQVPAGTEPVLVEAPSMRWTEQWPPQIFSFRVPPPPSRSTPSPPPSKASASRWRGEVSDALGFWSADVYRAPAIDGPYERLNETSFLTNAQHVDAPGAGQFYYQLHVRDADGQATVHGPLSVSTVRMENGVYLPLVGN